jgi:hypothetical protein
MTNNGAKLAQALKIVAVRFHQDFFTVCHRFNEVRPRQDDSAKVVRHDATSLGCGAEDWPRLDGFWSTPHLWCVTRRYNEVRVQAGGCVAHFEPFPGYADIPLLGHFDFQFYGSAAGRTYSAQAALLF